jgi:membrane associated rhomboid family serine protease
MPFLIPLGHEYIRKRFPKITISLIVINTGLYFLTYGIQMFQGPGFAMAAERLESYERKYFVEYLKEQKGNEPEGNGLTDSRDQGDVLEEFRQAMESGELVEKRKEEYWEWKNLYEEFQAKKKRLLFIRFGLQPKHPKIHTFITYAFLHGGFWHLVWNMYFLWLVGCNLEDVWGRRFFTGLYLAGAVFAGLAHVLFYFRSPLGEQPMIGASGAIAAVMGAFMIRYWSSKIRILIVYWIFWVPAWLALIAWFIQQLYYGLEHMDKATGVAFWAHIGGFVFGAVVAFAFQHYRLEEKVIAHDLERQDERDRGKMEQKQEALVPEELKRPEELTLGIEARKMGHYEEARELLEDAAKKCPDNFDVHLELQQVYQRMGLVKEANTHQGIIIGVMLEENMIEAAVERYHLLMKADPEVNIPGQSQYRMARIMEERRHYEAAATAYRKFAKEHPDDRLAPKALFQCGLILLDKLNQPQAAAGLFEYILKRYPGAPGSEFVETALRNARTRAARTEQN